MKKMYNLLILLFALFINSVCLAQTGSTRERIEMATGMRTSGKIYVVVAVVVFILAGLFFYIANLERKISRLEKEIHKG